MPFNNFYFSGQGKVFVAPRNTAGATLSYLEVGNVPALTVQLETDVVEHKESTTGSRLLDYRLVRENRARVTMTLENFSRRNLEFMVYGTSSNTTAPTTVTGESLTPAFLNDGVTAFTWSIGDIFFTKFPNISTVVLKDSATPTAATIPTTDYTVDLTTGQITMKVATGTYKAPLKVDYSAAAYESVQLFKAANPERSIRFSGLNTAAVNAPVTVELYRIIFDPTANINLINDELAQFELTGSVLFDATKNADPTLGGFGRIIA